MWKWIKSLMTRDADEGFSEKEIEKAKAEAREIGDAVASSVNEQTGKDFGRRNPKQMKSRQRKGK